MFKPGELEAIGMVLDPQLKELEMSIMEDIVRRIRINGEVTRAADWQITRLQQLGVSKRVIKKQIKDALGLSSKEINHLYRDILRKGYERDAELYKYKGKTQIPFEENEELQQLLGAVSEQTEGGLKNISRSLGFAQRDASGRIFFTPLAEYYQHTLDQAMLGIASGAFDYNTVLRKVVKELTDSGLRSVDYETGHSNRVEVAARRAVMTGMSQLTAKVNEQTAEELETDTFEITWHGGARPSHWWGGKWYTKAELISVCGLGTVTGLCGANCYHDYYPVIPGISEPTYTQEELDELNAKQQEKKDWRGKEYTQYEATQRQRKLETTMRAQRQEIKLLEDGGADEDDIIVARARYRGTSAEYARFSKAMDLPQQRERVTVDGPGNIGQGKYKANTPSQTHENAPQQTKGNSEGNFPVEQNNAVQSSTEIADSKPYIEVQDEYEKNATPGEGKLTHDKGCTEERYKDELDFAEWIHNTFGGNIHVLEEKNEIKGKKNPDYLWNGKLWDLKTPESLNGVNGRIRHGLHQIEENPGGIMINMRKINDYSYDELLRIINLRMQWVKDKTVDIMIVDKGQATKILRYKK